MTLDELRGLVAQGEGPLLEFKRTTGELQAGLETLCGFLNAEGGHVLFGVDRKGRIEGQQVSEQTVHEISDRISHFEPSASVEIQRIKVDAGREVLALSVQQDREGVPYALAGRAFERVGNTTRRMSQRRYETLLLERAHSRRRWENQPAVGVGLKDLDREEILRTRELAIQHRRITAGTERDAGEILDRLKLRQDGIITQAAQMLYGTKFLPDYPQGLLKLGRFRGTKITGAILDNRQEYFHAFAMVREAQAWLERTLPLSARFPKGEIFREDRLPVPLDALREVLFNAVMHRDYSHPSGYVAVAVFDDRIEIISVGTLPAGVTVDMLSKPHLSRPRNPLIAETFHLTGAVEVWGRGTNRVIDSCRSHGIPPPTFKETTGCVVVTFSVPVVSDTHETTHVATHETTHVTPQVLTLLKSAAEPRSREELQKALGLKERRHFQRAYLEPLLKAGWLEMTVPDKPKSRLQRYRTTAAGLTRLRG